MLGEDSAAGEGSWFGPASSGSWETTRQIVETAPATCWLATVRPDGRPHVMPVLSVWVNGMLFFATGQGTQKARNLVLNSHCVVAVEHEPLDLVIEGSARRARRLRRSLDGDVIATDDLEYDAARAVWNGIVDRRPALVARCTDAADVIKAVMKGAYLDIIV
jgi:hypothetical protein